MNRRWCWGIVVRVRRVVVDRRVRDSGDDEEEDDRFDRCRS